MKKIILASLLAIASSGCATMIKGEDQKVFLRSDSPDTALYVDGKMIGYGEASFIYKKNKNYTLKAERNGCKTMTIETVNVFDNITLVNPILTPIDFYTGAAMKPSMSTYVMNPVCRIL